jgi:hypothetical protein
MRHKVMELDHVRPVSSPGAPCVGRVVQIKPDGEILVDYPGNQIGPIRARLALSCPLDKPDQAVLLVFENGDAALPIIAGVVRDNFGDLRLTRINDRDEVVFEAKNQLTLACGKSSITLRSDGRIIVRGAEILSRASGTNKIRGASVKIN